MKKILSLIMIGVLSLFFVKGVNAKVYTIDELSSKYDEIASKSDIGVYSKVDTENSKLLIYSTTDENTPIFTFNYDDKSISYEDHDSVASNTEERFQQDILSLINISIALQSTLELMGYQDVILDDNEEIFNNYDKYGITIKYEDYEFNYESESGSGSISGTIIREFKLSLDSDKIARLISDFSLPALEFVPSIKAENIAENSITFTINSNYNDNSQNDKLKYHVYRSENEDYGFEKISERAYIYGTTNEVTDTNLEPGKTYYYKVQFVNNEKDSEIIKVTTSGNNNTGNEENNNENENTNTTESENKTTTEETTKDGRTNPKTGAKLPTAVMLIALISVIIMRNKLSKKSLFKRL